MNKTTAALIASAMTMTMTSFTAAADAIGVYAGAQVWDMAAEGNHGDGNDVQEYNFSDETQGRYYLALEHPVPFIPNVKIAHTELNSDGPGITGNLDGQSEIDFTYVDYTLYYELFDNGLFSFDLGVTAKDFDGDLTSEGVSGFEDENVEEMIPMLYASAKVGLPFTGLDVFAEGNFLSFDDSTFTDYQVGVSYALIDNLIIDVNISAGYRVVDLDLEDVDDVYADLKFDGAFVGVEVHF